MKERYLREQVLQDLRKKMVFLGGPRQVGKTTLARSFLNGKKGYLNWDSDDDRERILRREFPDSSLWIFDEIHKFRRWRNWLKGIYDTKESAQRIMVTGSARLDLYRYGGDSLQGRYHFLRLHPLSFAELGMKTEKDFEELYRLGGFPEPFFSGSETEARRWSLEYRRRLIREDVAQLENIRDLTSLELLANALPERVGSPLSINALREDLSVAHKTAAHWLDILEKIYSIYRVPPFGAPKIRAVKKEQKHYHLDWTLVPNEGARFENMIANHLLKWVHQQEDCLGRELELRYFRDVDGREVDFVVCEGKKPILFVECKSSEAGVAQGMGYLKARFKDVPAWQVSRTTRRSYVTPEGIRVTHAKDLLETLV